MRANQDQINAVIKIIDGWTPAKNITSDYIDKLYTAFEENKYKEVDAIGFPEAPKAGDKYEIAIDNINDALKTLNAKLDYAGKLNIEVEIKFASAPVSVEPWVAPAPAPVPMPAVTYTPDLALPGQPLQKPVKWVPNVIITSAIVKFI